MRAVCPVRSWPCGAAGRVESGFVSSLLSFVYGTKVGGDFVANLLFSPCGRFFAVCGVVSAGSRGRTRCVRIVGRYGSGADGVGTERLCRDAGGRFAAAGFRSGGGGRSGCCEIPVGCPIRRPKRLFIVSGYCKTTHYPPPKTLSLSGEGNAVEVRMKSGYAR